MGLRSLVSDMLPDEGWTCEECGHHNDDIFNDVCEECGADRSEDEEE